MKKYFEKQPLSCILKNIYILKNNSYHIYLKMMVKKIF